MKKSVRILSIVLSLSMLLSVVSSGFSVLAEGADGGDYGEPTVSSGDFISFNRNPPEAPAVDFIVPANLFGRDAESALLPGTTLVLSQGSYPYAIDTAVKFRTTSESITGTPALTILGGENVTANAFAYNSESGYWETDITGGTAPLNSILTYKVTFVVDEITYYAYNANYVLPIRSYAHVMANVRTSVNLGNVEGGHFWTLVNTWGSTPAADENNGVYASLWPTSSWDGVANSNTEVLRQASTYVGGYYWSESHSQAGATMSPSVAPTGTVYVDVNKGWTTIAQAGVSVKAKGMFSEDNMDSSHTRYLTNVWADGESIHSSATGNSLNSTSTTHTIAIPGGLPTSAGVTRVIPVELEVNGDRGALSSDYNYRSTMNLRIVTYNKNTLRLLIERIMRANHQERYYRADKWIVYFNAFKTAFSVYNSPAVDQAAVGNAITSLGNAEAELIKNRQIFNCSLRFVDDLSENVIASYSQTFNSGASITVGCGEISGYTHKEGEATTWTLHDVCEPPTFIFRYVPDRFNLEFVYDPNPAVNNHAGYYISDYQTASKPVSYNNSYGALPNPQMYGWTFEGWFTDTSFTTRVTATDKYMLNADSRLYAKWVSIFGGGHGSAEDPFIIFTYAHLQRINEVDTMGRELYFIQARDIEVGTGFVPIGTNEGNPFGGTYDGGDFNIIVPATTTLSASKYAGVFGYVSHACVRNCNVDIKGTITASEYANRSYTGFVAYAESSVLEDIHVSFSGTILSATYLSDDFARTGVVAGEFCLSTATDYEAATITDCSVTVDGGEVSNLTDIDKQFAFVGNSETNGSGVIRAVNNWVFLKRAPEWAAGAGNDDVNIMIPYDNDGTMTMAYDDDSRTFVFTGTPDYGWSSQIRSADSAVVCTDDVYYPARTLTGANYTARFVKYVDVAAHSPNGGTLNYSGITGFYRGEKIELNARLNPGYTFTGWVNTTDGILGSAAALSTSFTMGSLGGSLTAGFTPNRYKLIFGTNSDGAQVSNMPSEVSAVYDESFTLSSRVPSRPGYDFICWNTAANGTGTVYQPGQENVKNFTSVKDGETYLFAIWSEPYEYNITFSEDGGSDVDDIMGVIYNTRFIFPMTYKLGYNLYGWYENNVFWSGTRYEGGSVGYAPAKNVVYYARWQANTYVVRFNPNGGEGAPADVSATYNVAFQIPEATPLRSGYRFLGWDSKATALNVEYVPGQTGVINLSSSLGVVVQLYAVWENAALNITWDLNGGTINGSSINPRSTIEIGENFTFPADPEKLGFIFDGWSVSLTSSVRLTEDDVVTAAGSATYFARWVEDISSLQYPVIFNKNSALAVGSMQNQIFTLGSVLMLSLNRFNYYGYVFSGWALTPDGDPEFANGDVVEYLNNYADSDRRINLYAVWTPDTCLVQYLSNGGSGNVNPQYTYFDSHVTLRSNSFTRTGYTFIGWAPTLANARAGIASYLAGDSYTVKLTTCSLYAVWKLDTHYTYRLDVFQMKLDGSYGEPTTTWRAAAPGTELPLVDPSPGFEVDELRTEFDQLTRDGTQTFAIYYSRSVYLVRYFAGGNLVHSVPLMYGADIPEYIPEGLLGDFYGWYEDEGLMIPLETTKMQDFDIDFYADFVPYSRTVTFNLNGGSGVAPSEITDFIGAQVELPGNDDAAFYLDGYKFVGWALSADAGTQDVLTYYVMPQTDAELFAVWEEDSAIELVAAPGSETVVDDEKNIIYGIVSIATAADFVSRLVAINGNGSLELSVADNTNVGTGTEVSLKNRSTGELVKTYTIVVFGDISGDGVIDTLDISLISRCASSLVELSDIQLIAANINADALIDTFDVSAVSRAASGLITIPQTR